MPTLSVAQAFTAAIAHHQAGRLQDAEALYRQVLAMQPDHAEAWHFLGILAHQYGKCELAAGLIRRALELKPDYAEACNDLGGALTDQGHFDEAVAVYHRSLRINPGSAEVHCDLGNALARSGRLDEATAAFRHALRLRPDLEIAHHNLGIVLTKQDRPADAVGAFRNALEIRPDYAEAQNNLGVAFKECGELDEAVEAYRSALALNPNYPEAYSNLIYTLHFHPAYDDRAIAEEQQRWNRQFSDPLKPFVRQQQPIDRNPDRPLRIGYVSPDFRDHVVGRNLALLFKHHDREQFEIRCYSGTLRPDTCTEAFRRRAHAWCSTVGVSDEALADTIQKDRVDILVDLTQHTAGNRLPVFARRPAPLQVSFAGYPASTGIEGIGYRITDRYLEAEIGERRSKIKAMEQTCFIDSFWCYDPCGADVAVNELPAKANGNVTFGSLNNFTKTNERVLALWEQVLGKVAGSRLILLSPTGEHRQRVLDILGKKGIKAHRVEFVEMRQRRAYLELYHRVDITLDPFPYNGHTTGLDALWMGVPVVSLAGTQSVSRAGFSQLSNLGLEDLAAFSAEQYVETAVRLAHDPARLAQLRSTLRSRMETSPLMDGVRFARSIETVYRSMWRQWCAANPTSQP